MAYYLTYRPQKIADLDLKEVRDTLWGLLEAKQQPHALLLTGIRGAGKTSSARIWAKSLCCSDRQKMDGHIEPCLVCDACLSIGRGTSLDVIEIDAASHRGIDDIRELRDRVSLAPSQLPLKIYIIDEVHMLTTEAFNALLKTLEEPPSHVRFVLCTTEAEDVPETILSRCVQITFRRATIEEIVHSLTRVSLGEGLQVTGDALAFLARMGDGSFRDATKYLEEIAWMKGEITVDMLEEFYHMRQSDLRELVSIIHSRDIEKSLTIVEQMIASGADMRSLMKRLLDLLHEEWLLLVSGKNGMYFDPSEQRILRMLLGFLDRSWGSVNFSLLPQLALELALLEWVESVSPQAKSHDVPVRSVEKKIVERVDTPSVVEKRTHDPVEVQVVQEVSSQTLNVSRTVTEGDVIATLLSLWADVLQEVRGINVSIEAFLRVAKPMRHEGDYLILEVPYSFHRDKLQEDGNRRVVEQAIAKALGVNLLIRCEMGSGGGQVSSSSVREVPVSTLPPVVPSTVTKPVVRAASTDSGQAKRTQSVGNGNTPFRRRAVSTQSPVPTEEDEALVDFAEELFGK